MATGDGRWQLQPGFDIGTALGAWNLTLQAGAPLQFGKPAVLSSQAALSFGANGANNPAGGPGWLGPRYGVQSDLALGWDWYVDTDVRQTVGLELQAWHLSPLDQDGALTPDTEESGVALVPQLHAQYGRFHVLAGWTLPYLYAYNLALSDYGASHLRVDYGF